jgi:uncharacterized protein (DUF302 family)
MFPIRHFVVVLSAFVLAWSLPSWSAEGLVTVKSAHSVQETADRLADITGKKGLKLFARVDHTAGAKSVGKSLRPTQVLIFGNPQGGTPLMECDQTVGIDLPLKALVWEDAQGQVWIGYNDPAYLARRHKLKGCDAVVQNISKALAGLTQQAAGKAS